MKAAVVTDAGLTVQDVPRPQPKANEILVRVHASGLNRAELAIAAGNRHGGVGGTGTVVGLEWAGEVVEIGTDVPSGTVQLGDRVMCTGSGGYAEYAVCDWGRASKIPSEALSFVKAAALPMALQTMHDALITNGQLQTGESVLIQGASSGVGLMGLQIARAKGARLVIGSSTNPARQARLKEFGADLAIDTADQTWPDKVTAATDGKGVDLIVDHISATVSTANMKAAAVKGRIINVGRLGGTKGEFDFDLHALKRIQYTGVTFRTRSVDEVREIVRRMRDDLWPLVRSGKLGLPIDRTFPLDEAAAAQAHMRANLHFGKIVLIC
ncbi:MAG: zinc-binding dehydrogenase [Alphaproteobacteria bacterium]